MARITVEDCLDKIPNRFQLVLAATYRARMLSQRSLPCMLEGRMNMGDHRFDEVHLGVHGREVPHRLTGVADSARHRCQQQRAAGQRLSSRCGVGRTHVPTPPVVHQGYRAR